MTRLLVVDDDAHLRDVLSLALSEEGHEVDSARDGAEALAWLSQRSYDLILSDLRMPGLDGPTLYETLQARSRGPTHDWPRVIFMTGNAALQGHAAFLEGTRAPVLEKPFDLNLLCQTVQRLLER